MKKAGWKKVAENVGIFSLGAIAGILLRNFYVNSRDRVREYKERRPPAPLDELAPFSRGDVVEREIAQEKHRHFPE